MYPDGAGTLRVVSLRALTTTMEHRRGCADGLLSTERSGPGASAGAEPDGPGRSGMGEKRRSGIGEQLEDYRRVAVAGHVADQAEAELAREEIVPAPLHRTALGGNGAVEVDGLGQQERGGRLVQAEDPADRLARVQQRGADLDFAEGDRDSLIQE